LSGSNFQKINKNTKGANLKHIVLEIKYLKLFIDEKNVIDY